jgi:hypothetical protein
MYPNGTIKLPKHLKVEVRRGELGKNNKEGEFGQSTPYACMQISP